MDVGSTWKAPAIVCAWILQVFIERVGGAFRRPGVSPVKHLEERGRITNGQRTQHQRVENTEDGRGRADPERERQHGGRGERRTPPEAPEAVPKILSQPFPPDPHGRLPHVFADVGRISERFQRRASSMVGGQPFADVLGRRLLEVKLQIGIELLIEHTACKQRSNTCPRDIEPAHHRRSPSPRRSRRPDRQIDGAGQPIPRLNSFLRCVRPERVSE